MISKLATLKPFTKSSSFSSLLSSSAFATSDLQPTQVELDRVHLLACSEFDRKVAKKKHG